VVHDCAGGSQRTAVGIVVAWSQYLEQRASFVGKAVLLRARVSRRATNALALEVERRIDALHAGNDVRRSGTRRHCTHAEEHGAGESLPSQRFH
jgi:hypothetical protein